MLLFILILLIICFNLSVSLTVRSSLLSTRQSSSSLLLTKQQSSSPSFPLSLSTRQQRSSSSSLSKRRQSSPLYLFSNAEIQQAFNVATFLPQPFWVLMILIPNQGI